MGRLKYTPDSKEDFARMRFVYGVHGEIEHQKRKKRAWKRYWKRGHSGDRVGKFNKDENPRFTSTVDVVTKVNGKEQKVRLENGYNYKQAPKISVAHVRSLNFGEGSFPGQYPSIDKGTADIAEYLSQRAYRELYKFTSNDAVLKKLANKSAANGKFDNYSGALRTSYAAAIIKNDSTGKLSIVKHAFNDPKGVKMPPGTWVQRYGIRKYKYKKVKYKKTRVAYRQGEGRKVYTTVSYRVKGGSVRKKTYEREPLRYFVRRLERMEGYRDVKDIKIGKLKNVSKSDNRLTVIVQNTAPYSASVQRRLGKSVLNTKVQDDLRRVTERVSEKTLSTIMRRVRNKESHERKKIEYEMMVASLSKIYKFIDKKARRSVANHKFYMKYRYGD